MGESGDPCCARTFEPGCCPSCFYLVLTLSLVKHRIGRDRHPVLAHRPRAPTWCSAVSCPRGILPSNPLYERESDLLRSGHWFAANRLLRSRSYIVALCFVAPLLACSQEKELQNSAGNERHGRDKERGECIPYAGKLPVETDIAVTGMIPDGDYRLFRPLQQQCRKAHRTYQYTLSNKQTGISPPLLPAVHDSA